MTRSKPYTYATVRYTHDPVSGEFVHVGVVLVDGAGGAGIMRFRKAVGRVKALFPSLRNDEFQASLRQAERAVAHVLAAETRADLFASPPTAQSVVTKALPTGDQGVQLGVTGSGLTADLEAECDHLFKRFVLRHDRRTIRERRTDDDVWRPLRDRFKQADVAEMFEPATVRAKLDEREFKHTWRNGKLHCVEPLSFDLLDGDEIREKARRWLGRLSALDDARDQFKAYLVLAEPGDTSLLSDFEHGLALLQKASERVDCELVRETDADAFATRLASEMKAYTPP